MPIMTEQTKENLDAWGLAMVGAVKAVPELTSDLVDRFIENRQETEKLADHEETSSIQSTLGWVAIGAGVAFIDRYAKETLTHRAHRAKHQTLVKIGALYTAAHIAHLVPDRWDLITQGAKRSGWVKNAH